MKRSTYSILFICFISATIIAGCKKLDGPAVPTDRLKAILLGKDTVTLYAGEKKIVPVTFSPSSYSLDSILWSSLDTTVLSISKAGLISAKKPGTTTVSISNITKTISVDCKVVVKDSLWADMIAYYPFNNNRLDSSGNKNHIIEHKDVVSTTDRFGKPNSAYAFNGESSYMVVADKPALRLSGMDFTVSVWAKPSDFSITNGSFIMAKRRPGFNNGWGFSITGPTSGLGPSGKIFFGPGGNINDAVSDESITLNNWHLATITYSFAKKQIKIYINGVLINTVDNIPSPNSFITSNLYIGSDNLLENPTTYFYKGVYDDLRIYGRVLSAKEVNRLFKAKN